MSFPPDLGAFLTMLLRGSQLAAQSLLLTGAYFDDGADGQTGNRDKGFYLIDSPVNFERGERGNAEVWLDHDCRID